MADYFDDLTITKQLMKEIEEYKEGKRKNPSDEISKAFLLVMDRILTSGKYSGYTNDWKMDFRSKASELYVKHWHKFNPDRIQKNYYQKNNEKFLKPIEEWKGAHGWFTLLITTAIHDEIRKNKKNLEFVNKLADDMTKDIRDVGSTVYNPPYV